MADHDHHSGHDKYAGHSVEMFRRELRDRAPGSIFQAQGALVGAIPISASTVIVAINAQLLRRVEL